MQDTFSARELHRLTGIDRKTTARILATLGEEPTLEELVAAFVGARAPEAEPGLYSTSQLAKLSGLNRATITDRLEGIPASPGPKGSKRYSLADVLPALIAGRDLSMDEAKLKKMRAEAGSKELALQRQRGEVAPVPEISGYLQQLWKGLHNRFAVQFWRDHSATLHKAKTVGELADLGQKQSKTLFDALRANHKDFF
jgi:transcriptional regulator with XRE-family HTH domain